MSAEQFVRHADGKFRLWLMNGDDVRQNPDLAQPFFYEFNTVGEIEACITGMDLMASQEPHWFATEHEAHAFSAAIREKLTV
ncbi:hypothetical protein [Zavarzinella formosa]|uniref:hypothetical protein n=1 Tax=Zavarzinella formosa TaxID=360055 RepID=UPI000311571A|nr:hypothetical protein [Zavarzinella formosa]